MELQRLTWGAGFADLVPPSLLIATQEAGGIAAGAFLDATVEEHERLAGFVFGLPGMESGEPIHWSDMLAVRPGLRDRRIGERLKLWQRETVLARGYRRMRWTFDPLESRNAWLNFSRLGATSAEYVRAMYPDMDSPLHQGIGTDRLVVTWALDTERVRRRLAGADRVPSADDVSDLPFALAAAPGEPGAPRPRDLRLDIDADRVLVAIPADLQRLKAQDASLAREWRGVTRTAFETYFGRGYAASELVRLGPFSAYVLDR